MADIVITGPAGCCCGTCTAGCCLCGAHTTLAVGTAHQVYYSGTGCVAPYFGPDPVTITRNDEASGGVTIWTSYTDPDGFFTWTARFVCGPEGLLMESISQNAGYSVPCDGVPTTPGSPTFASVYASVTCDSSGFVSATWTITLPNGGGTWLVTVMVP